MKLIPKLFSSPKTGYKTRFSFWDRTWESYGFLCNQSRHYTLLQEADKDQVVITNLKYTQSPTAHIVREPWTVKMLLASLTTKNSKNWELPNFLLYTKVTIFNNPSVHIKWNCACNIIWKDFNINFITKFLYYHISNCCYYFNMSLLLFSSYAQKVRLLWSTAIVTQSLRKKNYWPLQKKGTVNKSYFRTKMSFI